MKGVPWSLRRHVLVGVRQHLATNKAVQRNRYEPVTRILRTIFGWCSYWHCVGLYALIVTACVLLVWGNDAYCAANTCSLSMPDFAMRSTRAKDLLKDIGTYFMEAQVGVLGVLSISVSLVALIAQRKNADAEVQAYYHESLALPVTVSSLALLTALCVQFVWPLEFLMHRAGIGEHVLSSHIALTVVHGLWLTLNLAGLAHFIVVSLSFGQADARVRYRDRYTANHLLPGHLYRTLFRANHMRGAGFFGVGQTGSGEPVIAFGPWASGGTDEVKVQLRHPSRLYDVRLWLLSLVTQGWLRRVRERGAAVSQRTAFLSFPSTDDATYDGEITLCRQRDGLPLTQFERLLVRLSFRFRRVP